MSPVQLALPLYFPGCSAANDPAFSTRLYRRALDPLYQTPEWRRVRQIALDRAKWRCENRGCGKRLPAAIRLDVHHVIPVAIRPDLFLVLSNLKVLCSHCHETATMQHRMAKYGWAQASA